MSRALVVLSSLVLVPAALGCSDDGGSGDAGDDGGCVSTGCIMIDANTGADSSGTPDAQVASCDGTFPAMWIRGGPDCGAEVDIQVHRYDRDTYILRQSLCTSFEGPFLYMFFGQDRVLLEDTGDGNIDIVGAVDGVIAAWEAETGNTAGELVVVNSHAHGDHTQGNGALAARNNTTVVGTSVSAVETFFGIANWPTQSVPYDLGGRVIDVIPIPGHQTSHIALFDRSRGLLLTGDTLYPGRLYISDFATYRQSITRMVAFTETPNVCHVLGTHIEMTDQAGVDFAFGSTDHTGERELSLSRAHLVELSAAVDAMAGNPQREVHDDFIITPL